MPGIEPPRFPIPHLLPTVQRSIPQDFRRLSGGICSVRAPPSSAGTRRRGCPPPRPGEAGAGRKALENRFGAGMWWEKPLEHRGRGPLVNARCHLCCPLRNAVRCRGLARLTELWGEAFSHRCFPLVILIPPGWWFRAGDALGVCVRGNRGQGAPGGDGDRDPLAVGTRRPRRRVRTWPRSCRQPAKGGPKLPSPRGPRY